MTSGAEGRGVHPLAAFRKPGEGDAPKQSLYLAYFDGTWHVSFGVTGQCRIIVTKEKYLQYHALQCARERGDDSDLVTQAWRDFQQHMHRLWDGKLDENERRVRVPNIPPIEGGRIPDNAEDIKDEGGRIQFLEPIDAA